MEPGPKLAESGSMILTAHSFLPSWPRSGWAGAALSRELGPCAAWCFPLREAIRPDRSGTCSHDTFLTIWDPISNYIIHYE